MVEVRLVPEDGEQLTDWHESEVAAPRPSYSVNGELVAACPRPATAVTTASRAAG